MDCFKSLELALPEIPKPVAPPRLAMVGADGRHVVTGEVLHDSVIARTEFEFQLDPERTGVLSPRKRFRSVSSAANVAQKDTDEDGHNIQPELALINTGTLSSKKRVRLNPNQGADDTTSISDSNLVGQDLAMCTPENIDSIHRVSAPEFTSVNFSRKPLPRLARIAADGTESLLMQQGCRGDEQTRPIARILLSPSQSPRQLRELDGLSVTSTESLTESGSSSEMDSKRQSNCIGDIESASRGAHVKNVTMSEHIPSTKFYSAAEWVVKQKADFQQHGMSFSETTKNRYWEAFRLIARGRHLVAENELPVLDWSRVMEKLRIVQPTSKKAQSPGVPSLDHIREGPSKTSNVLLLPRSAESLTSKDPEPIPTEFPSVPMADRKLSAYHAGQRYFLGPVLTPTLRASPEKEPLFSFPQGPLPPRYTYLQGLGTLETDAVKEYLAHQREETGMPETPNPFLPNPSRGINYTMQHFDVLFQNMRERMATGTMDLWIQDEREKYMAKLANGEIDPEDEKEPPPIVQTASNKLLQVLQNIRHQREMGFEGSSIDNVLEIRESKAMSYVKKRMEFDKAEKAIDDELTDDEESANQTTCSTSSQSMGMQEPESHQKAQLEDNNAELSHYISVSQQKETVFNHQSVVVPAREALKRTNYEKQAIKTSGRLQPPVRKEHIDDFELPRTLAASKKLAKIVYDTHVEEYSVESGRSHVSDRLPSPQHVSNLDGATSSPCMPSNSEGLTDEIRTDPDECSISTSTPNLGSSDNPFILSSNENSPEPEGLPPIMKIEAEMSLDDTDAQDAIEAALSKFNIALQTSQTLSQSHPRSARRPVKPDDSEIFNITSSTRHIPKVASFTADQEGMDICQVENSKVVSAFNTLAVTRSRAQKVKNTAKKRGKKGVASQKKATPRNFATIIGIDLPQELQVKEEESPSGPRRSTRSRKPATADNSGIIRNINFSEYLDEDSELDLLREQSYESDSDLEI